LRSVSKKEKIKIENNGLFSFVDIGEKKKEFG
jgi:hypothetical protein